MSGKPIDDAVTDDLVGRVLRHRVPGGSEVWHWVNGGGMAIDHWHFAAARKVIEAYIALTAAQQQGQAVAWLAADGSGRVIDHKAKAAGGRALATGSATSIYSIPLYTAPPSAPVGVAGLPQPFGYVEPRHDLSGYEVFDEPGPRRAAIWNLHGIQQALAQPRAHYSIDADPDGIRARVADAITGALAFGAQGTNKPPSGHWLEPFWDMARAESEVPSAPVVDEASARRLDDYLEGEFDIRIGKQAAHAALCHALAQQPAAVDEAMLRKLRGYFEGINNDEDGDDYRNLSADAMGLIDSALATQHQEPTT